MTDSMEDQAVEQINKLHIPVKLEITNLDEIIERIQVAKGECGCASVQWNPYNKVTQCHCCGRQISKYAPIDKPHDPKEAD